MLQSIFTLGKNVVRRIFPFGDIDLDEDTEVDPSVISPAEFLETFRKLSLGSPSAVNEEDLKVAVETANDDWFKVLTAKDGLLTLLNAASPESQKLLNELIFKNKKFLDAIVSNPVNSSQQFAAGVRESATIRRFVYLLLVALGMHSYEGYVLIYKTVNLLQRERPNGMFQYIAEEIAEATQSDPGLSGDLTALIAPLALMVVLFAGGNGFFIEGQLRHQIQSSKLLTSIVDVAQSKFVEEKHNRRLELPTLKEPAGRESTPQINRAIEILEQAERSSDKILVWLEKFANNGDLSATPDWVKTDRETRKITTGSSIDDSLPRTPVVQLEPKQRQPAPPAPPAPQQLSNGNRAGENNVTTSVVDQPVLVRPSPPETDVVGPSLEGNIAPQSAVERKRPVAEVHPMNGSVPVPPPPPPVSTVNGVTVPDSQLARSLLKPLRWTKLDTSEDVVAKSIWDGKRQGPQIDLSKLTEDFKNESVNAKFKKMHEKNSNGDSESSESLSQQTELHLNVILKQFPDITVEELAERIVNMDAADFDESQLKELLAALPSDQEMENIAKLDPSTSSLKPPEKFLRALLGVDHLEYRLKLMLFAVEFPVTERSLRKNCEDLMNACRIIQSSESFHDFLQVVLRVGNKMNEGRVIGDARAFETTILPKLADISSSTPGYSLLDFLVNELKENSPETLNFVEEFDPVAEAARIPLSQMKSEMLNEREKFGQLLEDLQETSPEVQRAAEQLLKGVRSKINSLTNIVVAAQHKARALAMYLMEDPGTFQIHEYLEMLTNFNSSIRHIRDAPARNGSAHRGNSEGPQSEPPSYAAPLLRDPRTASVLQSLRDELQTKLVLEPSSS